MSSWSESIFSETGVKYHKRKVLKKCRKNTLFWKRHLSTVAFLRYNWSVNWQEHCFRVWGDSMIHQTYAHCTRVWPLRASSLPFHQAEKFHCWSLEINPHRNPRAWRGPPVRHIQLFFFQGYLNLFRFFFSLTNFSFEIFREITTCWKYAMSQRGLKIPHWERCSMKITFKRKYIIYYMFAQYSNLLFFLCCKLIAHVFILAISF